MSTSAVMSATQVTAINSSLQSDVKTLLTSFTDTMAGWIEALADDDATLEIMGLTFEGDDKFGTAATLALNTQSSIFESVTSSSLNIYNMQIDFEETLSKMI